MKESHSYYRTSIWSRMHLLLHKRKLSPGDISNDLDGPLTQFSRSWRFWNRISQKQGILGSNTNRKSYAFYRMVPFSMTLSDFWPGLQGHNILWSRISDKVTVAQEETIPNIWNGTMFGNPWLISKHVMRVCRHQLSFMFHVWMVSVLEKSLKMLEIRLKIQGPWKYPKCLWI